MANFSIEEQLKKEARDCILESITPVLHDEDKNFIKEMVKQSLEEIEKDRKLKSVSRKIFNLIKEEGLNISSVEYVLQTAKEYCKMLIPS
ncbi:MAG: hypothetical protein ACYDIA_02365 [Candidatus Humimicrobiaceae bacterium]